MSKKQFTTKNIICSNYCIWDNNDKPYGNDDVVILLNGYLNEIQRLNKVIDLMEYQMKVQDRIIKEYEDGD
jgi:hypothetical protein